MARILKRSDYHTDEGIKANRAMLVIMPKTKGGQHRVYEMDADEAEYLGRHLLWRARRLRAKAEGRNPSHEPGPSSIPHKVRDTERQGEF